MSGSTFSQLDRITLVKAWKARLAFRSDWRIFFASLLLAAFFISILAVVQFAAPNLAGTDDYFHIKFAQLMRLEGWKPAFPWLPLSVLNAQEYYDHHFLYHIGLIPFTTGNLILGAKWASVLFASL